MSIGRCGICAAPTLAGAICNRHWADLGAHLDRCVGLGADLRDAIGRRRRTGESVGKSTAVPLPINVEAVDAARDLSDALHAALRAVLDSQGQFPRLTVDAATALLRAHHGALRGSWAAPVLLGDLQAAVPRAVAVVDIPKNRITVRVPCPSCGAGPLRPMAGQLECVKCRVRSSVGEVRDLAS